MVIKIAYDYTCAWCWLAYFQAKQLTDEFGVTIRWVGYEMYPEPMAFYEGGPPAPVQTNRPKTPTRFQFACAAQGIIYPKVTKPENMRIHNALEATEYAWEKGKQQEFADKLYDADFLEGARIDDLDVLEKLAQGIIDDPKDMINAVVEKRFNDRIVPFDDEAYAAGVYNLPTFFIGDERLAEQPYIVLREKMIALDLQPA